MANIDIFFLQILLFLLKRQRIQLSIWYRTPFKLLWDGHHQHHLSDRENPIVCGVNCVLTGQDVITCMDAWRHFVPVLACILITILTLVEDDLTVFLMVRNATCVFIVKGRLPFGDVLYPSFHLWGIGAECMIDVLIPYLAHRV